MVTKNDRLATVPLFSNLGRRELDRVAEVVTEVEVKAGTVLGREGHRGSEAFVIVTGTAAISIDGKQVASIGPGEVVGEMGLLDGGPRAATITAQTDMDLYVIEPGAFSPLLDEPSIAKALLKSVAARLRSADKLLHG
ncbi:MAG: cyclic nucleotide-binding domain-containing protein [Acidimicrobiia bacterium]|nr:cyclic nucleotide-binding domain-containing protein [Acidimicrobiia bacterium]